MQTRNELASVYARVRAHSVALSAPLSAEDQCIQSMPDASPTKWHLAHTTWFFEQLALTPHAHGYLPHDARYAYLFNSYYESLGARHPRPQRGLLTRPTLPEVLDYRRHVDDALAGLIAHLDDARLPALRDVLELGIHHEQQHQELMLTDLLHAFSCNPLLPAYRPPAAVRSPTSPALPARWLDLPGGVAEIGRDPGDAGFAFDNETPRHAVMLRPCSIADRLVTCGEYAAFIADRGYERPELWLSDGWAAVRSGGWRHPLYWLPPDDPRLVAPADGAWHVFGLDGVQRLDPDAPVSQLSFFEAAAYAEWAGARLPTEFEWEAAHGLPGMRQLTGSVWQWTRSSYDPYPGFRPLTGVASEYNGKFMVGQLVLRGGSVATPEGHLRTTYRNFFPPAARWQFSGIRVARDA
ncbi:ergothioneine biosynthesis protein EgtB [Burkholderia alba]|uniref:ergothioneine biosynthesis protein EgtB n=1 Tax=Burkholderia alba TaxID=2683677 RepID=UPI002B051BC4|nr:ergothioneine biosynthesis protein EgtB [Burkholderia alba]